MQVDNCKVGPLMTNCYLGYTEDACVLVDPGDQASLILEKLGERKLDMILITHGHFDHISALADLIDATGAPVAVHENDLHFLLNSQEIGYVVAIPRTIKKADILVEDGMKLEFGDLCFEVLHTPGHSPGSVCYYEANSKVLFSGDTLFRGTCGRTDFPGGNASDMKKSLNRLAQLPSDTKVYPGHDMFSTIEAEIPWISRL